MTSTTARIAAVNCDAEQRNFLPAGWSRRKTAIDIGCAPGLAARRSEVRR